MKSRFVVLRMKDIIRTGIFALAGLILLIVLIVAILPDGPSEPGAAGTHHVGNFVPGTYTAYIVLHNRPITVSVTVDADKILEITMSELAHTQEVFYPLIRPTMAVLSEQVIYSQSTEVAVPTEATVTGRILLDAINAALLQAR